jgi:hypothetical protein
MTVCIAAIFRWRYSENDTGWAVLGTSDRKLTSGDVEYEPPQTKHCVLAKRVVLLTAGAMHTHTEAIRATQKMLRLDPEEDVATIAEMHASNIRSLRAKFAAEQILSPFGMNHETFLAKQRDMSADFVAEMASRISTFSFDIESIIYGVDGKGVPDIFHIDGYGIATRHTDVGFMSIGIGAGHANLQLMSTGVSQHVHNFYSALGVIYSAKKSAEIAPGVGKSTDMILVTRQGCDLILPPDMEMLERTYSKWQEDRQQITDATINAIRDFYMAQPDNRQKPEPESSTEEVKPSAEFT